MLPVELDVGAPQAVDRAAARITNRTANRNVRLRFIILLKGTLGWPAEHVTRARRLTAF